MSRVRTPATEPLSARERQVLGLFARGTGPQDRSCVFISEATMKTHRAYVYEQPGVHDRAAAVAAAHELGLLGRSLY